MMVEQLPEIHDLLGQSRKQEQAGNLPEAIRFSRKALELALQAGDDETAGDALTACAQAFFRLGQYDSCRGLVNQALERVGPESLVRVDGLRILGVCALETNQITLGEKFLRDAIKLSRQLGSDYQLVRCLHNLSAGVYMPRGQFDLSLQADQEAYRICQKQGYKELEWGPLLTQAWVRWLNGQVEISRGLVEELALVVLPGSLGEGYVHLLHAQLALDCGDFPAAEKALELTFSLTETLGIPELQIFGRLARCRYLRLTNHLADAAAWAEDGYKIAADIGYRHLEGVSLIEKARLVWLIGRSDQAELWLNEAVEILDGLELRFDAARAKMILAAIKHQEQTAHASQVWGEAVRCILEGGFISLIKSEADVVKPLIAAYEQPGGILLERLRTLPPPPLRVVSFGGFRVWVGSREINPKELKRRRGADLLLLLLLSPGHRLQVEQVFEVLMPETNLAAAQSGFHQATSLLRRIFEPDLPDKIPSMYLTVEDGQIFLNLPAGSSIDFELVRLYAQQSQWSKVINLVQGEFLPEMVYVDWTAIHRQRINDLVQRAYLHHAREVFEDGCYDQTLEDCWNILRLEPWHEEAVLLGMKAQMALGDRNAARRMYLKLEKTYKEDLGSQPSEELSDFYRQVVLRKKT